MNKKSFIIISLVAVGMGIVGMMIILRVKKSAPISPPPEQKRLKVVTTIVPLYLTAREVGGSLVDVVNLIPLSAQPHGYQLTQDDKKNLANADIIITSGASIDAWADEEIQKLENLRPTVVALGKRLELTSQLPLLADGKSLGESDAHFWLDPGRMMLAVASVRDAFIEEDPLHKDQYWLQTSFFLESLGMIDRDFRERFKSVQSKAIVSSHLSMAYFISSFDLTWVGAVIEEPQQTPTPAHINALVKRIQREHARAVFGDHEDDGYAKQVAQQAGVPFVVFNPLETASTTVPESYETIMRRNMMAMSQTLGYEPEME
ncbi:MAG: metal ABC transporter substrate-binding protein [Patescibacteria group bacterium]